jgi:hypothetical protein
MVNIERKAIYERPGLGVQGAEVAARFTINLSTTERAMLDRALPGGVSTIMNRIRGMGEIFRTYISQSAVRSFNSSGLQSHTNRLRGEIEKAFTVDVRTGESDVVIIATWTPGLPYFFRRLFGFTGPDSRGRMFGRGWDKIKSNGYFLKFDKTARDGIASEISQAFISSIQIAKGSPQKQQSAEAKRAMKSQERNRAVVERNYAVTGDRAMRITPHRIRQELYRRAGLARPEARMEAQRFVSAYSGDPALQRAALEGMIKAFSMAREGKVAFVSQFIKV